MYGMMNPMGYQPPQMPQPQQYQPPFIGQWRIVGNYQEMLTLPVPMNGTPILVTLSDEPVQYVLQMQGGQKMISGFSVTPLPGNSPAQEAARTEQSVDARLGELEREIRQLCASLGEAKQNEPGTTGIKQQPA